MKMNKDQIKTEKKAIITAIESVIKMKWELSRLSYRLMVFA